MFDLYVFYIIILHLVIFFAVCTLVQNVFLLQIIWKGCSALSSFHVSFFSLFASVDDKVHNGRIQSNMPSATTKPVRWNTSAQPPINRRWFMLEGDGFNRWNLLHEQWCVLLQVSTPFFVCLFLCLFCTCASSSEHSEHSFFHWCLHHHYAGL